MIAMQVVTQQLQRAVVKLLLIAVAKQRHHHVVVAAVDATVVAVVVASASTSVAAVISASHGHCSAKTAEVLKLVATYNLVTTTKITVCSTTIAIALICIRCGCTQKKLPMAATVVGISVGELTQFMVSMVLTLNRLVTIQVLGITRMVSITVAMAGLHPRHTLKPIVVT
jgi:hypothetical protein